VAYDEGFNAIGFARNAQHFAPNHTVLMYNIGLGQTELENVKILLIPRPEHQFTVIFKNQVLRHCNHSRCIVITFDLAQFPSHVGDKKLQAVRPLIITDAAIRCVFWIFKKSSFF
jgi:hypothetical protein